MHTSTAQEIAALTKRLELLNEQAEAQLRQKLKEARAVVTDLEMQLSEITGRPSATQIKAVNGFAPITDDQLEVMILFLLQKEGQDGMNAKSIASKLNQNPVRIRGFIKDHPKVLKRVGKGPGPGRVCARSAGRIGISLPRLAFALSVLAIWIHSQRMFASRCPRNPVRPAAARLSSAVFCHPGAVPRIGYPKEWHRSVCLLLVRRCYLTPI